jgi:hypothetical protein
VATRHVVWRPPSGPGGDRGLSDRHGTTATPTLEERMDDVLAVPDAVGSQQASIRGWGMRSDWAVRMWAPSMAGDEPFTEWLAKYADSR